MPFQTAVSLSCGMWVCCSRCAPSLLIGGHLSFHGAHLKAGPDEGWFPTVPPGLRKRLPGFMWIILHHVVLRSGILAALHCAHLDADDAQAEAAEWLQVLSCCASRAARRPAMHWMLLCQACGQVRLSSAALLLPCHNDMSALPLRYWTWLKHSSFRNSAALTSMYDYTAETAADHWYLPKPCAGNLRIPSDKPAGDLAVVPAAQGTWWWRWAAACSQCEVPVPPWWRSCGRPCASPAAAALRGVVSPVPVLSFFSSFFTVYAGVYASTHLRPCSSFFDCAAGTPQDWPQCCSLAFTPSSNAKHGFTCSCCRHALIRSGCIPSSL